MSYKRPDLFTAGVIIGLTLCILVVLGVFKKADAAEATVEWTPPTQYCNGAPLTGITGYRLIYGQKDVMLPPTPLSFTVKGLTPGTWFYSMSAVKGDEISEFVTTTNAILPEEFVTTEATAYTVVKTTDRFILLPVGTAPLGTRCNASHNVNGHYAIPRATVTWSGLTRPTVVVAKCL